MILLNLTIINIELLSFENCHHSVNEA
jgi:hypothetical protein